MSVLPAWGLSIPLPAVIFIGVSIYMLVLALALWIRFCLKERYALACDCGCPSWSLWELCFNVAQSCDCRLPSLRSCLRDMCASPSCGRWDCACTCQPPECESCNCLCFEIRVK
ncbi:uncharacterized protein si:ch211-198p11.6 isoform X1 [Nerophis ophidion]|uniref:uncharacterized protein si:ch211-198p11.6 isoform X1 n=1 Tax=Nerophis ophidion TaxID=159077 RepID=UPI002ADFFE5E|nr:uncharacterized protein si:ch211-198p11.6 isoform X1 [Nerophis ophidion]XP_061761782.1 uncharacterized protein si:ch211-198p11.6 isoform X1 [Nerophis ophidion]